MRALRLHGTTWAVALMIFACGDGELAEPEPLPPNPPQPPVDTSAALFLPDQIVEVDIVMDPDDWNTLRQQTRGFQDVFGTNCLEGPPPKPFTYFPGDVTVDGTTRQNVGISKKGFFGSLDTEKPSLKVKINEYVPGQRLHGLRRLTFNNAKQDQSFIKQCIGYQFFTDAGVPASRCNFAHVTVNGNDLGLFVHVEALKKEFLRRHFENADGNMYEAALSDFRPDWVNTWERKTNEHPDGPAFDDRGDLDEIVAALEVPDDQLVAALEPLIDLDSFNTFWAAEVLISHWDGYAGNTNNTYIYRDPTTSLWNFIPWGIDGILFDNPNAPRSVMAQGILARRLYLNPATQGDYIRRAQDLTLELWDIDALIAETDRMETLVVDLADPDGTGDFAMQVEALRDFIRTRRSNMLAELDTGPVPWNAPLRSPPCLEQIGDVDATFATTWGSLGTLDPFVTGSGTFSGTYDGFTWPVSYVRAIAGIDTDPNSPPNQAVIQVPVVLTDGNVLIVHVVFPDPAMLQPGATIDLDIGGSTTGFGILFYFDVAADAGSVLGLLIGGSVVLNDAGTTPGAPLSGWIGSGVVQWGL